MSNERMDVVETRLLSLEKRLTRYRKVTWMLALVSMMALAGAAVTSLDVLRTEKLEVIGGKKTRIILDGASGTMTFVDPAGKKVLSIPAAPGKPQLLIGRARSKLEARRAIRKGMSQDEVRNLLGEPDEVRMSSYGPGWTYRSLFGGRVLVYFRDGGRVDRWSGL